MTLDDCAYHLKALTRSLLPGAPERIIPRVLAAIRPNHDGSIDVEELERCWYTDKAQRIADHRPASVYANTAEAAAERTAQREADQREKSAHTRGKVDPRFKRNIPAGIAIYNNTVY